MRIDADTHLSEAPDLWERYADPGERDLALRVDRDDLGHSWLCGPDGRRIHLMEVHTPGDVGSMGDYRRTVRSGAPAPAAYEERVPRDYWDPGARVVRQDTLGSDESVVFPNFGLLWERPLDDRPDVQRANMAAWNRWAVEVVGESAGRLHPVAHLSLRDPDWLDTQLPALSDGGVRLAMIAPSLVDGKRLSHPDLDRCWASFVEHGVTPVFHVEAFPLPFDEAWYEGDDDPVNPVLFSVFLWTAPALAVADLAVNGVFERHPDLRLGVFEFSALWVLDFLMYLDGGFDFHARFNGEPHRSMDLTPSEYVRRQVRVACFGFEGPRRLIDLAGEDLFMYSSDWPHAEGAADPAADVAAVEAALGGSGTPAAEKLFGGNLEFLLRRAG